MRAPKDLLNQGRARKALWLLLSLAALAAAGGLLRNYVGDFAAASHGAPALRATEQVWSAEAGFSSKQGANQWHYQTWTGRAYRDMVWDPSVHRWKGDQVFCDIGIVSQHPGASHDAARVWVAPQACTVQISGNVCKADPGGSGVLATVLKNSTVLWGPQTIAHDDRIGRIIHIVTDLNAGDSIYFRLNCNGDPERDATFWNPVIRVVVPSGWWQTQWFLAVMIASSGSLGLAGSTVALLMHLRHRRQIAEIELARALDAERSRIAQDIHDEIGAKLSRLSLLSEMAFGGPDAAVGGAREGDCPDFCGRTLQKSGLSPSIQGIGPTNAISELACETIRTLDELIWAVSPRNDTVKSFVHYVRDYAEEFFESTRAAIHFELPAELPTRQLSAETRHNLFCAVKEVLNNALKHSGATRVRVAFTVDSTSLRIVVTDDGRGFRVDDQNSPLPPSGEGQEVRGRTGDGLVNIRARLEKIHGTCSLETQPGQGTRVTLTVSWDKE